MGKNYRLELRISRELSDQICTKFQERKYPSPDDHSKMIHFTSKPEYIEHILRITNSMNDKAWWMFVHMFDPYWRE
jgi:hypothetical protein